ncbi:PilZ domain-containing protein [Nitrospira sp. BLG_1]|uniref:PilZ domain-containing protein n=1 Tax=Nitrospira sp. BLG_1 TaxID=3395883 RepID=UPI0039BC339A
MAFVIRPYRRLPAQCPVTYERLYDTGHGTAWNVSSTGFRVSGTLPLQPRDVCSLKVKLPKQVSVLAGVVRWAHGQDFGVETLLMDKQDEARLARYIRDRTREL